MLDIDEDYYGVMRGSDLLDGIDFSKIAAFDKLLGTIFTIKNIQGKIYNPYISKIVYAVADHISIEHE